MRLGTRVLALAIVGVLVGLPAVAETYSILLKNGTSFTTRYQPEDASWNPDKLIFLDEWGNLLSMDKADVDTITTETENRGFGHVLNSTTIAIGWAPNDLMDFDSDEGKAALAAEDAAAANVPPVYNQEQFVEPSAATGLPLSLVGGGGYTPPMGGAPAPQPVETAPPPPPGQ